MNYWGRRKKQINEAIENKENTYLRTEYEIYRQAQSNIIKSIDELFDVFAKDGRIERGILNELLSRSEGHLIRKRAEDLLVRYGLDPSLYGGFLYRLTRLDALRLEADINVINLAERVEKQDSRLFREILDYSYKNAVKDIKVIPAFDKLDKNIVDVILRSRWADGNYSSRIWGNIKDFASRLEVIMGGGLTSGLSNEKIARQIRDAFGVERYQAERLVRTESKYFYNQAYRQFCIDNGIEEYTIQTVIDGRTSVICRSIDTRERHKFVDVVVGVNYPPFHPNCRSSVKAVIDSDIFENRTRELQMNERIEDLDVESERSIWEYRRGAVASIVAFLQAGGYLVMMDDEQDPIIEKLQDMMSGKISPDRRFLKRLLDSKDSKLVDKARRVLKFINDLDEMETV